MAIIPEHPWRMLLLDLSDPADPRWVLAAVTLDSDVHPATVNDAGHYIGWAEVTAWVRARLGQDVSLVPIHDALAWTVDGPR